MTHLVSVILCFIMNWGINTPPTPSLHCAILNSRGTHASLGTASLYKPPQVFGTVSTQVWHVIRLIYPQDLRSQRKGIKQQSMTPWFALTSRLQWVRGLSQLVFKISHELYFSPDRLSASKRENKSPQLNAQSAQIHTKPVRLSLFHPSISQVLGCPTGDILLQWNIFF